MTPLDKLRQAAEIPASVPAPWALTPFSRDEAITLVAEFRLRDLRVEAAARELEQLRAELAAATRRCTDCGRGARELKPWEEQGQVVAWLGPWCHERRRQEAAVRPAALPIGGGS